MRRRVTLYIDGKPADLGEATLIQMNWTRESLENPSVVKNSYSQTVELPGTPGNDLIFGSLGRLDRTQKYGDVFDTLRKVPFAIYGEAGEVLESGYVKVESVATAGRGYHTYSVNLYGGLGGFFYNLSYNAAGDKMTLADLYYDIGGQPRLPDRTFPMTAATVQAAWKRLGGDTTVEDVYDIINFAPCYNGIPDCDFDADKALYRKPPYTAEALRKWYVNLYFTATRDQVDYAPRADANDCILLEMENEHTSEQVQDMRAYLQRPVMSVKGFLETLALPENSGDYTFVVDDGLLDEDANPWFFRGWFTLPMFDRDNISPEDAQLADLLSGSDAPADYLIGLAKMFGLVFTTDPATKTVTLMSRDRFYSRSASEVIDLEGRVDETRDVNPYPMTAKWYVWGLETYGEFAEQYAETYDREYGSAWVDTGYGFDAEQEEVLDGVAWKGAADVLESNPFYAVYTVENYPGYDIGLSPWYKFALSESVSWKLYKEDGSDDEGEFFDAISPTVSYPVTAYGYDNRNGTRYEDFFMRVQLHGEDGKAEDGDGVLMFFNGFKSVSVYDPVKSTAVDTQPFHLSDDCDEMMLLNEDVPCWDVSPYGDNIVPVSSLPVFGRGYRTGVTINMTASFDLGDVRQTALPGNAYAEGLSLYDKFWSGYISDRYDGDVRVVTAKVDFRGIRVGEELLSRFFYFSGSRWVLNRIINYSLTTFDLVECEFVRVMDMDKYTNSQAF